MKTHACLVLFYMWLKALHISQKSGESSSDCILPLAQIKYSVNNCGERRHNKLSHMTHQNKSILWNSEHFCYFCNYYDTIVIVVECKYLSYDSPLLSCPKFWWCSAVVCVEGSVRKVVEDCSVDTPLTRTKT